MTVVGAPVMAGGCVIRDSTQTAMIFIYLALQFGVHEVA
jgi:hypothetical protein